MSMHLPAFSNSGLFAVLRAYGLAVAVITLCFAIPAIALCRVVSRENIVLAIALLTAAAGFALMAAGWKFSTMPDAKGKAELFVLSGAMTLAASALWPILAR